MKKNSKIYEYQGETLCEAELCEKNGIAVTSFRNRIKAGQTVDEALSNLPSEQKETQSDIKRIQGEMTKTMLRRAFSDNPQKFEEWVDEQISTNSFKFYGELLPKYLKFFDSKDTDSGSEEKAIININLNQ